MRDTISRPDESARRRFFPAAAVAVVLLTAATTAQANTTANYGYQYARECYNNNVPLPPTFGNSGGNTLWVFNGQLAKADGNNSGNVVEGQSFNAPQNIDIFYYTSIAGAASASNAQTGLGIPGTGGNKPGTCMMAIRQAADQQNGHDYAEFVGVICQGLTGNSCMWTLSNSIAGSAGPSSFPWGAGGQTNYPGITFDFASHAAIPPFTNAWFNNASRTTTGNVLITSYNADSETAYPANPGFVGGLHLANNADGVCTACHTGENMFVNHPGSATDIVGVLFNNNLTNYWFPSAIPNPIVPNFDASIGRAWPIVTALGVGRDAGYSCSACHNQPPPALPAPNAVASAGRFPDLSQLADVSTGHDYCSNVLLPAMERMYTTGATSGSMPPGGNTQWGLPVNSGGINVNSPDGTQWRTAYSELCRDLFFVPGDGVVTHESYQSSVYNSDSKFGPANGNDANRDGNAGQGVPYLTVFHTNGTDSSDFNGITGGAWWLGDFTAVRDVKNIVLWNRTDCCTDRLSGFRINYYNQNNTAWYLQSNGAYYGGVSSQETPSGTNTWAVDFWNDLYYWSVAEQSWSYGGNFQDYNGLQGEIVASGGTQSGSPGGAYGVAWFASGTNNFRVTANTLTNTMQAVNMGGPPLHGLVSPNANEAWGISVSGYLYHSVNGADFDYVPESFPIEGVAQLAISPFDAGITTPCDSLWAVSSTGKLYNCNSISGSYTFVEVALPPGVTSVKSVAVGGKGNVWITPNGNGAYNRVYPASTWTAHTSPAPLVTLAVSDDTIGNVDVWALDATGKIYKDYAAQTAFVYMSGQAPNSATASLSTGGPGDVWAIGTDNNVYNRATWMTAVDQSTTNTAGRVVLTYGVGPTQSSPLNFQTRYLMVQKAVPGTGGNADYLHLAEVEAYGSPAVMKDAAFPPAAPTGLTATPGNAQVALSWAASSGATSYTVYRGTASGAETAFSPPLTTTTFTATGLTNGTTYYFKVRASNGGDSPLSSEVSATPVAPPPAPTNLTTTPSSGQIVLSWTASAGATSYTVYRGTTSGGETALSPNVTTTTHTSTGLTNGTTYYFKVLANNAGGSSPLSGEVSATPAGAPAAPTNLTTAVGNGQIVLSWTASAGATSYTVWRGTTSGGETALSPNVTTTTHTSTGLTNGTTYYFKVKANNANGASGFSSEVNAKPIAPPTNLTTTPGNGQIVLSWTASAGATSYTVYRGTTSGGETALSPTVTTTTHTSTGLTNGTTYYFKVLASNANGSSALSSEVSAVPVGPPAAPTNLVATPGNGQVVLTWTASASATSYTVYRGTTSGGETALSPNVTATTHTSTGLTNGTTYYFKVKANNASGSSALSGEVNARPVAPPAAPTGLTTTVGNGQIVLTWTASANATSYTVYRGTTSGGETALSPTVTTTTHTSTGLTNGTTYYFKVLASNASGSSALSSEVNAKPIAPPTNLTTTPGNGQIVLSWTASAGATSYTVYRGTTSGGETALSPTVTTTTHTSTGLTNGTTYYFKVLASNANGSSALSSEVSATPVASAISINAGGPATGGWLADTGTGGSQKTWTNAVDTSLLTGTIPPQTVLQSARVGNLTYNVTGLVANSSHTVTLYFVENFQTTTNSRVFTVSANGTAKVNNLDVFAVAGAKFKAIQRVFTATADGTGKITLTFVPSVDNATVSGIVVQ